MTASVQITQMPLFRQPGYYLSENDVKERLSIAYIYAISTIAGFGVDEIKVDRDSIDVEVRANDYLLPESKMKGTKLALQLKATSARPNGDDTFSFRVKRKNYDDLREPSMLPRLLIVYLLPEDCMQWCNHGEDATQLQTCAYWYNLYGSPKIDTESTTIHIPKINVFSPSALRKLMEKASMRQELGNAL